MSGQAARRIGTAFSLLALASAAPAQRRAEAPLRVVMLDADGGAAALFVTPEGRSMLVDTGWPTRQAADAPPPTVERIVRAMAALGLKRIDYLLITHYHFDHVGGARELMARVPVAAVIDHGPNREPAPATGEVPPSHPAKLYGDYEAAIAGKKRLSMTPGDTLAIGSMRLQFVASDMAVIRDTSASAAPTPGCDVPDRTAAPNENDHSLGFVATFGKARILDLGDLTWNQEKRLVCPHNRIGRADLMLVTHHGSSQSNPPPLIEAAAPRVALVANGPRKGGDAAVFDTLSAASSRPAIWYGHFATRSPEKNPAPDRIANLDGPDGGHALAARVWRDGTIEVTNDRNRHVERYGPR